jgi:hypothetical protein
MWGYDDFSSPKHLSDAIEILGCMSCAFGMFIIAVHWAMMVLIPTFRIQTHQTRIYSAKNMAKSIALCCYMPLGYKIIMDFFDNTVDETDVRLSGTLYACTDIAGLFIVPRLNKTTVFHHLTVATLSVYNLVYAIEGIWIGFVIYGAFSTFTFIVNTTLSLKWVLKPKTMANMCILAFIVYAGTCLFNWVFQLYFVRNYFAFNMESYIFIVLLLLIVIDDVVLMRWLVDKNRLQ